MKPLQFFKRLGAVVVSILAIAACGGGGGGSSSVAGGGTGGTGVSMGTVTDFGSIFVNGVEFSTVGATIRRDDNSVAESDLRRGMVVEVGGSIASSVAGTATTVTVKEAVRGLVEGSSGTAAGGTLTVLGQTVRVDGATIIDNSVAGGFAGISAGDLIEVHGFRLATGEIYATFIEGKMAPITYAVRGTVNGHGVATFTIGALTVNFATAVINDMPAGNWDGLPVEVKGLACTGNPVCGTLTATKVELDGLATANAAKAEVEGLVTDMVSTSDFTIGNQRVLTTGSTVYSGGLQAEIALGVKIEAEGSLANGVLTAVKVVFKDNVQIESNATVAGASMTFDGLPGVTATANGFTVFKNSVATSADLSPLNGRNVRIRGRATGASMAIALEIEDRGAADPNADVILRGVVAKNAVANPTFTLLGIAVDTSALLFVDFKGDSDAPIGSAAFFAALAPNGGMVEAKGRLPSGGNVMAAGTLREVELED